MRNQGFTAKDIAKHYGCSASTVYKHLYSQQLKMKERYSDVSEETLLSEVAKIQSEFPNAGYVVSN